MDRHLVIASAICALVIGACTSDSSSETQASDEPATATSSDLGDGDISVHLIEVAKLQQPLGMAVRRSDRSLYFAQKTGEVIAVRPDGKTDTILDLSGEVSQGDEQGLLGLTFAPSGRYLYTNHTDLDGDTHITEWRMGRGIALTGSRREVLEVDQPREQHNGGDLAFGPDGYLYIGLGDGGGRADPMNNARSLNTLLGKILRIDPRGGGAYAIPEDNPFRDRPGVRAEIWAYGLRNPWRFSFDRQTGDLWIADVGEHRREEINFQPSDSDGGENYGWDTLEGSLPFEDEAPADVVMPIHEFGRDLGVAVIGGYVYRGSDIPDLTNAYVFASRPHLELRYLVRRGSDAQAYGLGVELADVVAFGEDLRGELYVLSLTEGIYRIESR